MADDLQYGSEVVDFLKDSVTENGLVNKRNMKLHANVVAFSLMIKEAHAQRTSQSTNKQCVAISLCDLFLKNTVIISNITVY